jgi:hypothetical protein
MRYGVPNETRIVGRTRAVAEMSETTESGTPRLPRRSAGLSEMVNTVTAPCTMALAAES